MSAFDFKYDLKYLFVAEFADGTFIKQTPSDKSEYFMFSTKSMFTDVLAKCGMHDEFKLEPGNELHSGGLTSQLLRFYLVDADAPIVDGIIQSKNFLCVDLTNGWFQVGQNAMWLGEQLPAMPKSFKVVYFRRVRQNQIKPAVFRNPKGWENIDGALRITDSAGTTHDFTATAEMAEGVEEYVEDGENKTRKVFHVWPMRDNTEVEYVIGWQCTIAGRNYQQTIAIM
jgi:hypothetical protein